MKRLSWVFAGFVFSLYFIPPTAGHADQATGAVFSLPGDASIMEEEHFGIVNGKATVGINYRDAGSVSGLWAPPYVSSDFLLELQISGAKVPTQRFTWNPMEVQRTGDADRLAVDSTTALLPGLRAGLLKLILENQSSMEQTIPIQFAVKGSLDRTDTWEFSRAQSSTAAPARQENGRLIKSQGGLAIVLWSSLEAMAWDESSGVWQTSLTFSPGEKKTAYVAFSMGDASEAANACDVIAGEPENALAQARNAYEERVQTIFSTLPTLTSPNPALVRLYNRSLVHFLMNRWDVPEFVLHPYYSTGSVKGGCVCNYLWNFGEVWEILPLYDPAAAREHIKQFLKTDLSTHFAFMPVTGEAFGPWYPVNQEKILGLIYYYVKNTGDTAFLQETVDGKRIVDWAVFHALLRDDPSKPVELIDYGPSNSHLELRRGYPYNHVMPDLNGRRYANYMMTAQLCYLAGEPAPYLPERASALKALLKEKLWNPETKWFWFMNDRNEKDARLTVQIFKLFGSAVLDTEEEAGLLSHLNELEFLSEQGLHSMSKTDIAYDQVDIDNGGGGICTSFVPQIAERLYKSGHPDRAEDLLRRTLWWGERMPYWGDSLVANSIDYRKDTPLQCTLDGVAVAQCIIFGMFGVSAQFNGDIVIDPHPARFAPQAALKNLRLRGMVLEIATSENAFEVISGEQRISSEIGRPVVVRRGGTVLEKASGEQGEWAL